MHTEAEQNRNHDIHVKVTYAPAGQPYNDEHANPVQTVGALKAVVLTFFKLHEGPRPDGSVASYTLYFGKIPLEDMAKMIGAVAGDERKLQLKLAEQIVQGDDSHIPTAADLAFEEDLEEAEATEDAARWLLERGMAQEAIAQMSSKEDPQNKYQARLLWRTYPLDAPSLKFRNPDTGSLSDPVAWPIVRGFRPSSLDACVNYCIEGFGLHPEWQNDARLRWRSDGNVLLKVLRILQGELDDHYSGRHKA